MRVSFLILVLFAGCELERSQTPERVKAIGLMDDVKVIVVREHSYLRFERAGADGVSISVVHDPDCERCKALPK